MELGSSTLHVAKTKALISCAVTAQLICGFVFACAKIRFSHVAAQITTLRSILNRSTHPAMLTVDYCVIIHCFEVIGWLSWCLHPQSTAEVMSGLSAILATVFLGKPPRGRLPVLSAYSLAINLQILFLNQ